MVSYCSQLLLHFDCHINVEISAGLETVKYLSKYIYKGPDRATMEISGGMQDEIKAHLNGWFIGPTEACWKIFEFNMHGESPACKGTSRVVLSQYWGSVLLVAQWQYVYALPSLFYY